jgi:hypothetical protein
VVEQLHKVERKKEKKYGGWEEKIREGERGGEQEDEAEGTDEVGSE